MAKLINKAKKLYDPTHTHEPEHEPEPVIPPPPLRARHILSLSLLNRYPAAPDLDELHLRSPFFAPTLAEENPLVQGIAAASAALSALPSPPPKPLLGAHVAAFTHITAAIRKWRVYTIPVLLELYNFTTYKRPYNKRTLAIEGAFNAVRVYALMIAHIAHVKRRFVAIRPGNERLLEGPWRDLLLVEEQLLRLFVLGARPRILPEGGEGGFSRGCVGMVPWYRGDGGWEVKEEIGDVSREMERRRGKHARNTETRGTGRAVRMERFPVVPMSAELDAGYE